MAPVALVWGNFRELGHNKPLGFLVALPAGGCGAGAGLKRLSKGFSSSDCGQDRASRVPEGDARFTHAQVYGAEVR